MHRRALAFLSAVLLGTATLANAATTIDRQFTFDAARAKLLVRGGYTQVQLAGAASEKRAGHPDLPWRSERVELPPGQRVVSVEVTGIETQPLSALARIAPARVATPGLGPEERTAADASVYGRAVAQPEQVVELGTQGSQRGREVAYLGVSAAQWNPVTGELRAVTKVSVRLHLEGAVDAGLVRERIVPEWEDAEGMPAGLPTRALGATLASATGAVRGKASPFRATQLPSVLGSPVAYVIVTNDAMAPVFQQLADWKTQTGLPAVVRTVSFIKQQYPSAADDAERIRLFLRDAYTRWGAKWVLLGGDTDVIPTRLGMTTFYGGEMIATDLYYSCLDGNWNADGDSLYGEGQVGITPGGDNTDLLPEVYVGRAPVTTPTEAQVFVNKTLQYERTPLGTYEDRWMFFAEVLFPQPWSQGMPISTDGADYAEALLTLTDMAPELHVARLYENYTDPAFRPGVVPESRKAVIDSINVGYGLGLHIGHGYRNVMECGDESMTNPDAAAFTNGNKLMNLYAINCTSVAIDFPCIGEAFLLNPNGGAVTNVGSTRFDFPSTSQVYQFEYFRLFFQDSVTAVGELTARQKLPYLPWSFYDGADRWTQMAVLELGDPELRMWRGKPRTLVVTNPGSVALSDTQFTVQVLSGGNPVANARVTAYRAGDDFQTVTTDAAGNAVVPFRPDSVGTLKLTATAFNARPWQGSMAILPSSAPVVVEGTVTIVDDGTNGTSGDGNGSLDAGETADLRVELRNQGGSVANGVTASLSTTDPLVTVTAPSAGYGSVSAGSSGSATTPVTGFRISTPYTTTDQREVPFQLVIRDGSGRTWRESFQLVVHAPELRSWSHGETESPGNGNGRPEIGETVNYTIALRNGGTGTAHGVTLKLRSADGLASVTDSVASFGDIAPGATVTGDAVTFLPLLASTKLTAVVSNNYGVIATQTLDLSYPPTPTTLAGVGQSSGVSLTWAHLTTADLLGYNVYRSSSSAGPFAKVAAVPTDRIAYYTDSGLAPLTQYYYRVTAVDSSGNESGQSLSTAASTNPPSHGIFPVPMGRTTPSSVALESIYSTSQMDIVVGSDVLYVLHADGSAPVDADGSGATLGDFTRRGSYYASGPSVAVLQPGQGASIVGASWDSAGVYVYDRDGNVRPGWPLFTSSGIWSSVAIGDLDGDGKQELCFGSNGPNFYVMRADGSEWMDGDSNPATKGVFKVFSQPFNYGSPALADLDGDGKPEILYGARDGNLYAWKANGTNVPGFPFHTSNSITSSVAVGFLDGAGDTQPEIVFTNYADSLFVVESNGQLRAGWPKRVRSNAYTERSPAPAIADMNKDGLDDVIAQGTDGALYCFTGAGTPLPNLYAIRYSTLTDGASECSPVVADINGDGWNDIVTGDENGLLTAFSGADGSVLPGFPIQLSGEVRGTPGLADIDHDGKTEIVVADWDKNIYVWDYDFPFQPSGVAPWPQFQHDSRRTGYSRSPQFVTAVDDGPLGGGPVLALEFAAPSPNPARGSTRMWFGIPSSLAGQTYELAIYDLGGRLVRTVDRGIARPGQFSLQWDLRDSSRHPVDGGIYFARFTVGGHDVTRKVVVLQ